MLKGYLRVAFGPSQLSPASSPLRLPMLQGAKAVTSKGWKEKGCIYCTSQVCQMDQINQIDQMDRIVQMHQTDQIDQRDRGRFLFDDPDRWPRYFGE